MEHTARPGDSTQDLQGWFNTPDDTRFDLYRRSPTNFLEITRLPKKIEPKTLTSMIVSGSRIVPKQTEICCKDGDIDKVALVEFRTNMDALQAVERLRLCPFASNWRMKLVGNPKFANPERELVEKWFR